MVNGGEESGMNGETATGGEIAHAAARGVVGAMAMSGVRAFTVSLGLVDQEPPKAILRKTTGGLIGLVPKGRRRAAIELCHWAYGAAGGAAFGALPDGVRRRAWAGPVYGLVTWLGFELGIAPALGLRHAKQPRPVDRLFLAIDHLIYGLVLSEGRRRPQE
jgi:hypothetical protein